MPRLIQVIALCFLCVFIIGCTPETLIDQAERVVIESAERTAELVTDEHEVLVDYQDVTKTAKERLIVILEEVLAEMKVPLTSADPELAGERAKLAKEIREAVGSGRVDDLLRAYRNNGWISEENLERLRAELERLERFIKRIPELIAITEEIRQQGGTLKGKHTKLSMAYRAHRRWITSEMLSIVDHGAARSRLSRADTERLRALEAQDRRGDLTPELKAELVELRAQLDTVELAKGPAKAELEELADLEGKARAGALDDMESVRLQELRSAVDILQDTKIHRVEIARETIWSLEQDRQASRRGGDRVAAGAVALQKMDSVLHAVGKELSHVQVSIRGSLGRMRAEIREVELMVETASHAADVEMSARTARAVREQAQRYLRASEEQGSSDDLERIDLTPEGVRKLWREEHIDDPNP